MAKSLIEQLPEIVKEGRRVAERILESIEGKHKVSLQTREEVMPNKDVTQASLFGRSTAQHSTAQHSTAQLY
jgi:adenine-specific DNA-methyltransferase